MYLYTDVIEFAPFESEENRGSPGAGVVRPSDEKLIRPSPKSMYRLADKVCRSAYLSSASETLMHLFHSMTSPG